MLTTPSRAAGIADAEGAQAAVAVTFVAPELAPVAIEGAMEAALAYRASQALRFTKFAPKPSVIREIAELPDGARLTARQVSELSKNIEAILAKSLPAKAKDGRVQDVVELFQTDPRFRFLDQLPVSVERINEALSKFGASLE